MQVLKSETYLKSEQSELFSRKANSTNYFKQFLKITEPDVIQTEIFTQYTQSQTNNDSQDEEKEDPEEQSYVSEEETQLSQAEQLSERHIAINKKVADVIDIFNTFKYEPP